VHRGEFRFATEGNAVNPRIGSGLKYGRRVVEEQTVEVVENHEDGSRMGAGVPIPKEVEAARRRDAAALRETDSTAWDDGGAIFGQPQERKPGVTAGPQGPGRVGNGAKVRRVAHLLMYVRRCGPVEGPRGPERGDALQGRGGQR